MTIIKGISRGTIVIRIGCLILYQLLKKIGLMHFMDYFIIHNIDK